MWDILSIGPHYRCLRQTHPSVDDIMLSRPSLHYIAVVVEVAEAKLHPVFHVSLFRQTGVLCTLHFDHMPGAFCGQECRAILDNDTGR